MPCSPSPFLPGPSIHQTQVEAHRGPGVHSVLCADGMELKLWSVKLRSGVVGKLRSPGWPWSSARLCDWGSSGSSSQAHPVPNAGQANSTSQTPLPPSVFLFPHPSEAPGELRFAALPLSPLASLLVLPLPLPTAAVHSIETPALPFCSVPGINSKLVGPWGLSLFFFLPCSCSFGSRKKAMERKS